MSEQPKPRPSTRQAIPRHEQARARRAQILATAKQLFREQGFMATTTKQIAQALGVAESLVFHYFPTKADLVLAMANQPGMFPSELAQLPIDEAARSAEQLLLALAQLWQGLLLDDRDLFAIFLAEAQANHEIAQMMHAQLDRLTERLTAYFAACQRAGIIRPQTPCRAAAQAVIASAITLLATHRFAEPTAFAQIVAEQLAEAQLLWAMWLPERASSG
jgi:AcrR family transcriptional regulator